jgi:uncharacterized protein YecE (DUF72 family)
MAVEGGMAKIRVGIGGWVYAPWRGSFYPLGLPQARELAYAGEHLTSIEINGTFYGAQKPASFRKWRSETPAGFVFSVKGPRYATHRRDLAGSGSSIERFFASGVSELGDKLGPILWQFPPSTRFEAENFTAFFELLPQEVDGRAIRHVVEVRHDSFLTAQFIALLRRYGVAAAIVDGEGHQLIADVTADFVYARLRRTVASEPSGYPPQELDRWLKRFRLWAEGKAPKDLPLLDAAGAPAAAERDCFVYFISGAKERAPAAAQAMIERLGPG